MNVTIDFAQVPAGASFDALASAIVAAVEGLHPAGEGDAPRTESASAAAETTGMVTVRRHQFSDDSLAGYEYIVTAEASGGKWTVISATRAAICYRGVTDGLCA